MRDAGLSADEYRLLVEHAPIMIWRSGTDGRCDYFNQPWLDFTGHTLEEERGDGWAQGVHPDDLARCLETYRAAFQRRETFEMEYRLLRSDGEYRWIHDRGVPIITHGAFAGYVGSCVDVTARVRAQAEADRDSHARLALQQQLTRREICAHESIGTRVASDLYSEVAQAMVAFAIEVSGLKRQKGTLEDPLTQAAFSTLQQRALDIVQNVRRLSNDLYPTTLHHIGLVAALEAQCVEIERRHDVWAHVTARGDLLHLDPDVALGLFRIAQEALLNAAQHAHARQLRVALRATGLRIELTVADDGRGFDISAVRRGGRSLGLAGMEERARLLGGDVHIHSRSQGTAIRVRLSARLSFSLSAPPGGRP
jgi:PAS domain S-box-containing protein